MCSSRRWLILVAMLVYASPAWASWSVPNAKTGSCGSSPCSTAAFASSLTNPSIIVAFVTNGNPTATLAITDTAGNSYSDCGPGVLLNVTSTKEAQCFLASNTQTTSSNVVKVTVTGTVSSPKIIAFELTGGATSSPVDGGSGAGYSGKSNATGGAGGSNNLSGTAITTVTNGDIVLNLLVDQQTAPTIGTSPNAFTSIATVGGDFAEYFVQANAGAITGTASSTTSSDQYAYIQLALKPAGAAAKCAIALMGAGAC